MKTTLKKSVIIILTAISVIPTNAQTALYLNEDAPIEQRIEDVMQRLTIAEKVALCHAQSKFSSAGVPRLGIPDLWCTDGPHGIRPEVLWDEWEQAEWTNDSCTAFPALTCLAATWNRNMANLYGLSIGEEARYREKDVLLGPGVNIYRTPLNGRNFEYMGEDPYLAGQMVVPYIKGVQQNGVATCVKHFALNNQEDNRHGINVIVDDRALYEIYLPAFKAAVIEGGTWSIMGSYNRYKGEYGCHNQYLLNDILRNEWNFEGVVISDWGGTHDTRQAITNGLDIEFGTWTNGLSWGSSNAYANYYLAQPYLQLIKKGEVGTKELDEKVRRILRLMFRTSMNTRKPFGSLNSEAHIQAARKIAQEGIVLLKNDHNALPIDTKETNSIAVIGENALKMMTIGGGSSSLKAKKEITPLDGIRQRAGKTEVLYARGYVGDPTNSYNGVNGVELHDARKAEELFNEAENIARKADCVIFIGGLNKSDHQDCEGVDRLQYELPYAQNELIERLAAINKRIIVINISGNAVAMPWKKDVAAILQGWFLGSEAGHALADILFGDVNPSGKMPFSIMETLADYPQHSVTEYPGKDGNVHYTESIFVGYRYADLQKKNKSAFPFGHGLSYTTFAYSKATANVQTMTLDETLRISIDITNTGNCEGSEIVQLYISDKKSSLPRPVKELKGFEKITLAAGETKTITFEIQKEALSFFDDKAHAWIAEPGQFEALIGASSNDIRSKVNFTLKTQEK